MMRLPIRLRLTLAFMAAMTVVLLAGGLVLHKRLSATLTDQVDERLRTRAAVIADALGRATATAAIRSDAPTDEDSFAQIVSDDGRLVAASGGTGRVSIAPGPAEGAPRYEERRVVEADGDSEPARIVSLAVRSGDGPVILVIGESLTDRRDALDGLTRQLAILGPAALAIASLLGYLVAGGALRPVDAMRRRAEEIGPQTSGDRLPLPPARDEVRRLGETLNAMLARLDEAIARERRFVADAGHELRTPLALLQAELELAERRPRNADELTASLHSAREEVERLSLLAEDLLDLAAAESGGAPLDVREIALGEVLEAVAQRFAGRAERAGRNIHVAAPSVIRLTADRGRLERAVANLVDNALHHGGGEVTIATSVRGDRVVISVADRGTGIPTSVASHVFEPFTSSPGVGGRRGSGLGLAIVRAVAEAHGGSVRAGSSPVGGAVVSIEIPVAGPPR